LITFLIYNVEDVKNADGLIINETPDEEGLRACKSLGELLAKTN
jgi:hypothetical protein